MLHGERITLRAVRRYSLLRDDPRRWRAGGGGGGPQAE
jgi:hypothetical protein